MENWLIAFNVISITVCIIAVFTMYLTRQNILYLLNKDLIIFDQNFEFKKSTLVKAMSMIDEIEQNGQNVVFDPDFTARATQLYNELLCATGNIEIAEEFYNITIKHERQYSFVELAQFKLACRDDIGFKIGRNELLKRAEDKQQFVNQSQQANQIQNMNNNYANVAQMQQPNVQINPAQDVQPQQPVQEAEQVPEQVEENTIENANESEQAQQAEQPVLEEPVKIVKPVQPVQRKVLRPAVNTQNSTIKPATKVVRPAQQGVSGVKPNTAVKTNSVGVRPASVNPTSTANTTARPMQVKKPVSTVNRPTNPNKQ